MFSGPESLNEIYSESSEMDKQTEETQGVNRTIGSLKYPKKAYFMCNLPKYSNVGSIKTPYFVINPSGPW